MIELSEIKVMPEIIGVIGTLSGTILGWILGRLSQHGKLSIYPTWKDEFKHLTPYGEYAFSKSKKEAEVYSYSLSLDIYNSSGEPLIMRKIEVVFCKDNKELFRDTPEDDSTGRNSGPLRFYDKVLPITIPAKTVYTIKLHGGCWNNNDSFSKIWETNNIQLAYRDSREKERKVLIVKDDFQVYFENHSVPED